MHQEESMAEQDQKKSYTLFIIWLSAFAVLLTAGAIHKPNIAGLGTVKSISILMYVMLDILLFLVCVTGRVYWMPGVSYEESSDAGVAARKKYAFCHLCIFLGATALYLAYCFGLAPMYPSGAFRDSLTAGAIVCIASVCTSRIRL